MKYFAAVALAILIEPSSSLANNEKEAATTAVCLLGVQGDSFVSYFPIKNPRQDEWSWDAKGSKTYSIDYSWVGEPGYLNDDGNFVPGAYAFGLGHRSGSPYRKETTGSIESLINLIGGAATIYLNNEDKEKRAQADVALEDIPVRALYREGGIMIVSRSPEAVKVLFSGHPTYARMVVKTPYASQSYECSTVIDYLKSRV